MYKRTITYEDYDGKTRTEDFLFYLTKAEIIKWLTTSGDYTLDKVLMKLTKEQNGQEIMKVFEDLIKMSYGEKSIDGRRFSKSPEILANFVETEAYSILFTELCSDAEKAAAFVNAVIPKDLAAAVAELEKKYPNGIPAELNDYAPSSILMPAT